MSNRERGPREYSVPKYEEETSTSVLPYDTESNLSLESPID